MHVKFLALAASLLIFTISLRSETALSENHLLYQIIENESHCVAEYSEEKIFLNPENIFFSTNGPLLNLNGHEFVALPKVMANHLGFYIERNSLTEEEKASLGLCPHCDRKTDGNGVCRNWRCDFYLRKVLFKSDWWR